MNRERGTCYGRFSFTVNVQRRTVSLSRHEKSFTSVRCCQQITLRRHWLRPGNTRSNVDCLIDTKKPKKRKKSCEVTSRACEMTEHDERQQQKIMKWNKNVFSYVSWNETDAKNKRSHRKFALYLFWKFLAVGNIWHRLLIWREKEKCVCDWPSSKWFSLKQGKKKKN